VGSTFPLADVFVTANADLSRDVRRFFELLFGHPSRTPTRAEMGMFHAHGASLRSSVGRQVGAAICRPNGDLVACGANEVAKAFGGQYWEGDVPDYRDHTRSDDSNRAMIRNILFDLLARLKARKWLSPTRQASTIDALVTAVEAELEGPVPGEGSLRERAYVFGLIEFMRAVHAEMAALCSAAARGASIDGNVMYTTTFPCHECAKHVVAAGISKLMFIAPYPKSRAPELYDDSIDVDGSRPDRVPFLPFVGVAPRRFPELFLAPERTERGLPIQWDSIRQGARPRGARPPYTYLSAEQDHVALLGKFGVAK
jgi:deoxycytidylate deaminase